jgi:hypothetical protein
MIRTLYHYLLPKINIDIVTASQSVSLIPGKFPFGLRVNFSMTFITSPALACRLIPHSEFLNSTRPTYDKLVVGVALIHPLSPTIQVLIVQRATHEKVLPGVYELPGGSVASVPVT